MTKLMYRLFLPVCLLLAAAPLQAQLDGPPLGAGPWVFDNFEEANLKVSVLARGMDHPFGLVFIPGTDSPDNPLGDVLLSERSGKVRLFRNGSLREQAVVNLAEVFPLQQLFDIELHPRFAENGLVYFTFIKKQPHPDGSDRLWATTALARGRWDGQQLAQLEEVFVASEAWSDNICGASSRLHFLVDGTLLMGVSHRCDEEAPQRLDSHIGKILRLNDDGSAPADNPYYAVEGALPEIFTWGNRSVMDFVTHPDTGAIWELENGPQGGDEVNIIQPGVNFGWPRATYGRDYDGTRFSPQPWVEGTKLPEVFWVPSITVASLGFYTGSRFPKWTGNLFVTSMIMGRIPGTGHLERVVFNEEGEIRREQLLVSLKQRIRYVVQGPDELLYLLTDSADGALLRLEPTTEAPTPDAVTGSALLSNAAPANEALEFPGQDCGTCHRSETALVGPSYRDIARRYAPSAANEALLAERIIQGGPGAWGEIPMTPHPALGLEEALQMSRQILQLEAE